jgi:hypothetical protein
MRTSGKIYGYIPLTGDGMHVAEALRKIRLHEIKATEWENALRTARYLDSRKIGEQK